MMHWAPQVERRLVKWCWIEGRRVCGRRFSKSRQLDGWIARPQMWKIMYFSFFLDFFPPTIQLDFMKPVYESVVCYQFIWFCVMTVRVRFSIFFRSAWVFGIFHVDAFVLVCQLVSPSQLPWSLLLLLFITLSKQNGYRGGAHFFFSKIALACRQDVGCRLNVTWRQRVGFGCGRSAEMISFRRRKLSLWMDKYIRSVCLQSSQ